MIRYFCDKCGKELDSFNGTMSSDTFRITIEPLCKCFIHFFRALFCKDYYTESHGLGMCGQYEYGKCFCEYRWCPKRKGADNEAD